MAPGMIFDSLLPGESVEILDANRPNSALIDFRSAMLKMVAAGAGSSYSSIARDYDGTYSSQRQELVESFAASLGLEVEYRFKPSIQAIIEAVENGEGDLAAAGLTITENRREKFLFGPPYQDVTQQVVCRRDNVQPEAIGDLVGAVGAYERDDVLRAEVLLVVLERHEPVLRDRRVGGEDVRHVGLAVLQRLDDGLVENGQAVANRAQSSAGSGR